MVVIYLQQHLPRVLFVFILASALLLFPESTLLLRGAVCLTQNLISLTAEAGLGFISVVVWTFFFFPGTCCFSIQLNQLHLWPHLMALQAFLAALRNDVLIARILLHSPAGVSHGCTYINPTSLLVVLLPSARCCPLYPRVVAHN